MNSEFWLNSYYRTIVSSFSINNTQEQNFLLLNEINDFNPELIIEAYNLMIKCKITKYQYLSNETRHCFYVTETDKTHFTIHGYCTCFRFRDNLLIKQKEFSCVHEMVLIILEYVIPHLNQSNPDIFCKTICLTESEFLDKIKTLSVF